MAKDTKKLGRSNPVLVAVAVAVMRVYYRLFYGVSIDRTVLKTIKGPAIVLSPHLCKHDPVLLSVAVWPARLNFVGSEHLLAKPVMRFVYKLMHVIPKKMFCNDVATIRAILRAKREGNVVGLYPEGRLTCYGHTLFVTPGTADLLKKLEIDVYVVTPSGAYLSFPKWAKYPRHGKIRIAGQLLFSGEELKTVPVEEVRRRLDEAICHDDELAMSEISYRCKDMTAGLDGILYRCPKCGAEGTVTAGNGHITCSCGLDATLDNTYRLHNAPFDRINEWVFWQKEQMDPDTTVLESHTVIGTMDEKGNTDAKAGEGIVRLDRDGFAYDGTLHGEPIQFTVPVNRLGGLPITVNHHFDVYRQGEPLYFYLDEPRYCAKWTLFCDRLHEQVSKDTVKGQ